MKSITIEDIEALLQAFGASSFSELHFEMPGFEIFLSDDADASRLSPGPADADNGAPRAPGKPDAANAAAAPSPAAALDEDAGLVAIAAPSLGHFYRSPKPGAPPFVEVGQPIDVHDTVCVIEVMKLFTLLEAGQKGVVRRICVEDGALVEFGQPLIYIEPAS